MKKFKSKEIEQDIRICGDFNDAPLSIARARTKDVRADEKMHAHSNSFEYYMIISGTGEMIIDGNTISIGAGDVILVEPGEFHKITAVHQELDYIVIREPSADKIFPDAE